MIYLLHGENLFRRDEELARLVGEAEVERYTSDEIDESRLVDIFSGATLFAAERVVVVDELSSNKSAWGALSDWLDRVDDSTTVILCERHCDKRTKAYKALQKKAKIIDCQPWTPRQSRQAEQWLAELAPKRGVKLSSGQIGQLVARSVRDGVDGQPMIDQALLATVVGQLRHAGTIDDNVIDSVMAGESHDNVFGLLEAALVGDHQRLDTMIERLRHHQDGHRVIALLSAQGIQLAALVLARSTGISSVEQIASDIGAHPYGLRQMSGLAKQLSLADAEQLIDRLAWADERLKRGAKPWLMVSSVLRSLNTN